VKLVLALLWWGDVHESLVEAVPVSRPFPPVQFGLRSPCRTGRWLLPRPHGAWPPETSMIKSRNDSPLNGTMVVCGRRCGDVPARTSTSPRAVSWLDSSATPLFSVWIVFFQLYQCVLCLDFLPKRLKTVSHLPVQFLEFSEPDISLLVLIYCLSRQQLLGLALHKFTEILFGHHHSPHSCALA